jgi:hypothetical protein
LTVVGSNAKLTLLPLYGPHLPHLDSPPFEVPPCRLSFHCADPIDWLSAA